MLLKNSIRGLSVRPVCLRHSESDLPPLAVIGIVPTLRLQPDLKLAADIDLRLSHAHLLKSAAMGEDSSNKPTGWEIDGRVERLVATALHDIRNPLNAASLFAQLLVQQHGKNMTAEPTHIASEIPRQLMKARKVLDGIATLISVLSTPPISDLVSLEDVLDSALKSLEPDFGRCNGRVERETLPTVRGNGEQLGEVFKQILSNALRFGGGDVVIRITCLSSSSGCTISVRDSGLGFEPTYAAEIFEPFKRFHDPQISGAGLGLAICREVLSRHGGLIWAESTLGEGSVFHLHFPRVTNRLDPAGGLSA